MSAITKSMYWVFRSIGLSSTVATFRHVGKLWHVSMLFRASHKVCGAMRLECCGWAVVTSHHHAAPRGSCGMVERCLHSYIYIMRPKPYPSRKLTNSRWGGHPATIQTTAFARCFLTAEHACSTKKSATGCSKQTHVYVKSVSLLVTYHVFQLVVQCSCSPGYCTTLSCTSSWLHRQPARLLMETSRVQKYLPTPGTVGSCTSGSGYWWRPLVYRNISRHCRLNLQNNTPTYLVN